MQKIDNMKKIIAPLAIAIMAFSVSSCDFFRLLAGRPTSAQLAKSDTVCCAVADSSCCKADSTCCAAVDSTCCESSDSTCCCAADSVCCGHCASADSVCCGKCSSLDSLAAEMAAQMTEQAAQMADSIKAAAQELVSELATAAAEVSEELAAAASELAAEVASATEAEAQIVKNLGQKTGFLQIDVKYNSDTLVNEVAPGYYILVGTFSVKANADRIERLARNAGLNPVRLEYASGKTAIGVLRTTVLTEAFISLGQIRNYGFAPKDACILVVE